MKRLIQVFLASLIIAVALEVFIFNNNYWCYKASEPVAFSPYYGSGIDWNSDSYLYINDPGDALLYYKDFSVSPKNFYLNYQLVSSDKKVFDLVITELDAEGNSVTYRHYLNYDMPSTFYLVFDQPLEELIVNITDMSQCVINDMEVAFNQTVQFSISYPRIFRNTMTLCVMEVFAYILYSKWRENHG